MAQFSVKSLMLVQLRSLSLRCVRHFSCLIPMIVARSTAGAVKSPATRQSSAPVRFDTPGGHTKFAHVHCHTRWHEPTAEPWIWSALPVCVSSGFVGGQFEDTHGGTEGFTLVARPQHSAGHLLVVVGAPSSLVCASASISRTFRLRQNFDAPRDERSRNLNMIRSFVE